MDDIKKRFVEEIKLRGYDDKFIDKNEEREILQLAIQQGITLENARGALAQVCEIQNYVLESGVQNRIKHDLEIAMGDDGKIDEKEFTTICASARKGFQGKRSDLQVKRQVLELMEETGNTKVKTGWFSDWYARARKEVGMA